MLVSKLGAKAQTTVPKAVRQALALAPGDAIAYEIEGGRVILRKAESPDQDDLRAVQATLTEWLSPEDAEAYDDL